MFGVWCVASPSITAPPSSPQRPVGTLARQLRWPRYSIFPQLKPLERTPTTRRSARPVRNIRRNPLKNTPQGYSVGCVKPPKGPGTSPVVDQQRRKHTTMKENTMATHTYTITGMSCSHCENAVREEIHTIPGLHVDTISSDTGTLTISSDGDIDDTAVLDAIAEAGYTGNRL